MASPDRALALSVALSGVFAACGRTSTSTALAASSSSVSTPTESPDGPTPAYGTAGTPVAVPASGGAVPWPELVRDEQWDGAWRALQALPQTMRHEPDIRYVQARVALARRDASAALPLLDGLEAALPLLASDVERRRAEAQALAGPFATAGEWFSARSGPAAQLEAARAFEKAGDLRRARQAAEHVIEGDKKSRSQEAEARALRARMPGPPDDAQRADARWLAIQGADLGAASDALNGLARVDPVHPLTGDERMQRARALTEGGQTDEALRTLDAIATAPGGDHVPRIDRMRARATALYRARGRYSEAARALAECAALGGPNAAEDAFHAARALSRADRDEEAVRGYEAVQRRYPKTVWSDQAGYLVPYLRMLHGRWRDCARGFQTYVRASTVGDSLREARADGALCALLEGKAASARVEFEHLVEDEPEPTASARLANLAALAAERDGDRAHAFMRWTDVIRSRPLSWPAVVAHARLVAAGATVPAWIDPPAVALPDPAPLTIAIPPPADLLHRLGLEQDAESALRERENLVTNGSGGRTQEALCEAYGQLGRARRRYQIGQALPSSLLASAPTRATQWAWDCAYPQPYASVVTSVEDREQLPHGLLWAVMRQESSFDPDAVSPARAVGLMQLLPETARSVAGELALAPDDARLTNPEYAIRVGARALHKLIDRFHGSVPLAVAGYNGGAESVERWLARAPGMQMDTFVERIPFKETRDYVIRVMGNFAHYGYMAGADGGVPRIDLALPPGEPDAGPR